MISRQNHSRRMAKPLAASASGFALLLAMPALAEAPPATSLEAGFASPPAEAHPRVMWGWQNGSVTAEGITRDLEWLHKVGVRGKLRELPSETGAFQDTPYSPAPIAARHRFASRSKNPPDHWPDAGWSGS